MKATMNAAGVITLTPETGAEAYALAAWATENHAVSSGLASRADFHYWRSEGLIVSPTAPTD